MMKVGFYFELFKIFTQLNMINLKDWLKKPIDLIKFKWDINELILKK
jgi:hypothetical protein